MHVRLYVVSYIKSLLTTWGHHKTPLSAVGSYLLLVSAQDLLAFMEDLDLTFAMTFLKSRTEKEVVLCKIGII